MKKTDSQLHDPTYLKQEKNNIQLQLKLQSDQKSFLIRILNLLYLQCFQQTIDSFFMSEHKELNCYFDSPKDLMKHLTLYCKDLDISQKGQIKFSIKFSEAVKPKIVCLDLKEKKLDKFELLNTKMEKMNESYEEQLSQKDSIINQLKLEVSKMKESYEESNKLLKNLLFYTHAHPQGYDNPYFSTKFTGKSIIIHHNFSVQEDPHAFVFNDEIVAGSIKKYTLKVLNCKYIEPISFVFGSRLILNKTAFDEGETVHYQCDGRLQEGTLNRQTKIKMNILQKIQCELDLINYTVKWIKNEDHFATTTLPEHMRNKSLYFALILLQANDEVEVMLD